MIPICLMEKTGLKVPVLAVGSAFGAEGYARMSFATDMQTLERGFDSLSQFLRG
jgi:aspartate/methionine/tyrosine aminotransferase